MLISPQRAVYDPKQSSTQAVGFSRSGRSTFALTCRGGGPLKPVASLRIASLGDRRQHGSLGQVGSRTGARRCGRSANA
jgi:hypothetical protein